MSQSNQLQSFLPKIVIILLVLASILPLGLFHFSVIFPMVEGICVFYWSLYRPRLVPYWFVFTIGLAWDALYGWPLGITALGCVAMRFLVAFYQEQLTMNHFSYFWRVAGLSLAFYALYKWLILSIVYDQILPKQIAFLQWAMTLSLYPFFHGFFNIICQSIPEKRTHA